MIRRMVSKSADGMYPEGAFSDFPKHSWGANVEVVVKHEYQGCVLAISERNMYDDSDFYATVWDFTLNRPKKIMYASTRYWSYPCNAIVDATEEVKQLYAHWCERARVAWKNYKLACSYYVPKKEMLAKSKTTKGKNVGLEGRIFWMGNSHYSAEQVVGIKSDSGRVGYVPIDRILVWHELLGEWVCPATYSKTFDSWVVPEATIASPKEYTIA